MRLIFSLLLNGLLVYAAAAILPGVWTGGFLDAIIVALVLGLVNAFIRPLLTLMTLPITVLTLGLFMLVINGAMVLLVDWLLSGFSVRNLGWAVLFSVVLALFNGLLNAWKGDRSGN
jgi:putative membrane protein